VAFVGVECENLSKMLDGVKIVYIFTIVVYSCSFILKIKFGVRNRIIWFPPSMTLDIASVHL